MKGAHVARSTRSGARRWGALVPLAIVLVGAVGGGAPARGDAPSNLAVYDAQSAATPVGITTKVPAESDGGLIFASSLVELGKSQATAAGETLGPLGDAFVTTSVPGLTNPTFVEAQYPPSLPVFPQTASAKTSLDAGPLHAVSFHATTDGTPSATASAVGGSGAITGLLSIGGATSNSSSVVKSDGTVTTTATSTVSGLALGPAAAPLLTIASMTSTATVTVPPGNKAPIKSVTVSFGGALAAGVPIEITQNGIEVSGSLPVPAAGVGAIDAALAALETDGLTIQAVPVTSTASPGGATVEGAALEIGYALPQAALEELPTDIGTNETVLLGQVTASATGRPRMALNLSPPPQTPPAVAPSSGPGPVVIGPGATVGSPSILTPPAAPLSAAPPAPAVAPTPFSLPRRVVVAAAVLKFRTYYDLFFLLGAVVLALAVLLCRSTRLVD